MRIGTVMRLGALQGLSAGDAGGNDTLVVARVQGATRVGIGCAGSLIACGGSPKTLLEEM